MRVLFPFVGDTIGGSHVSALALIARLPEIGIDPVIAVHRDGLLSSHLNEQGLSYLDAPDVGLVNQGSIAAQVATMARAAAPLRQFLKRHAIDVVHANDSRMHLTWLLASRLAGCHFVWHQRTRHSSRRLAFYGLGTDAVLTISQYCRQAMPGAFGRRAIVLDNPFDSGAPTPDRARARRHLLSELGARDDAHIVGFVGNIVEQKRPRIFVECAALLSSTLDMRIVFPMIGEPRSPEAEKVSALIAAHGLEERCRLLGSRTPIDPVIAGFDVLVAPAVAEGFGRVLVEAMLAGTPVVATDDGGHREIVRNSETGLLVPPDDATAMTQAVASLLHDPVRRRLLAEHARLAACERFSSRRHAEAVAAIYRRLATAEHGRAGDT